MAVSVTCFAVGPVQANCYLLKDGNKAILIDPGEEAPRLLHALDSQRLELEAIWLTHAHFDHVGALAAVLDALPVKFHMHPADEPLLTHAASAASAWGIQIRQPPANYVPLSDGERLAVGSRSAVCRHTPGHSPGHVAFYFADDSLLFSGDALFRGSIGRTDLPFGDHELLIGSIKSRLLTLPGNTLVWPGHGDKTTIAEETISNPFLR